jgi:hypothetical protein
MRASIFLRIPSALQIQFVRGRSACRTRAGESRAALQLTSPQGKVIHTTCPFPRDLKKEEQQYVLQCFVSDDAALISASFVIILSRHK